MNDVSLQARPRSGTGAGTPAGANDDIPRKAPEISVNPTEFRLEDYLPYRLSLLSNTVSQGIAHRYQQDTDWHARAPGGYA